MSEERVFLSEGNLYVSNTKVVLHGTTYATANITSVSKRMTPAKRACSVVLILFGAVLLLPALAMAPSKGGEGIMAVLVAGGIVAAGVLWFRSLKPTYHLLLASASGEREGLTSQDEGLVDRVAAAITDAITHRG